MQRIITIILLLTLSTKLVAQQEIKLIVRGDDMGSAHAANLACIEAYKNGVQRSVEVMVPTPWFEEAVVLLNENKDLDVGIHIVLTSEWENIKWRPVSDVPSLVDKDGYFHPMVRPYKNQEHFTHLSEANWKIEEIEKEFRAQIELALDKIPHISHLTEHMGCAGWNEEIQNVYQKLAKEYGLNIEPTDYGVKRTPKYRQTADLKKDRKQFIAMLNALTPGTYLFVHHPGYENIEMQGMGHVGYYNVATVRGNVTKIWTDKKVKKVIEKKGIQLIGYKDLKE